ncbi:glutamic-type intramembrane protease PrsW [Bacillus solimangrovi]|uniref:Protease PrsW n=1 Tax=Bacillus solimangrovi TaxID=1305675 RepID=A0A1E5LHC6_9BACI|nr:glutamic-type intramembrane protease PrsW [Bacillus solimangrovi]OEH93479.1 peptidase [Bacillus solimangrovi]
MLAVISAGIAPGLALLSYFYLRDQYDTEPVTMVFRSFLLGVLLVFPIMFIQYAFLTEGVLQSPFANAFLLSGLLEEFFKWFIMFYTVYQHSHFDERYDGIVYGVAVSLGFATVENILYLFANGVTLAIGRALLPVSSHAIYGVVMGYYLGIAKFSKMKKSIWIWASLIIPVLLHGMYDYILLQIEEYWLYVMVPFMIMLWMLALRKVKVASQLDEDSYKSTIKVKKENIKV